MLSPAVEQPPTAKDRKMPIKLITNGMVGLYFHATKPLTDYNYDLYQYFRPIQAIGRIDRVASCDKYGFPYSYRVTWISPYTGDEGFDLIKNGYRVVDVDEMMEERWSFFVDEKEWLEAAQICEDIDNSHEMAALRKSL